MVAPVELAHTITMPHRLQFLDLHVGIAETLVADHAPKEHERRKRHMQNAKEQTREAVTSHR